jgi:nucleoside-diphosphate-sugar epimerase
MRAVVTGCAGFIGSHLVERLVADGWRVTGVDSFTPYYDPADKHANLASLRAEPRFDLVSADVATAPLDRLLADRPAVLHLAAQPGVRASFGEAFDQYVHDNVLATQRIFEASAAADCRRVVYASSSSVYGDAEHYPCVEGTTPTIPLSPYGVTKRTGEHLGDVYRRLGLDTVGLRYFTVYGPRQRPDMAMRRLCEAALGGPTFRLNGDGSQSRAFTHVDDVVDATVRSITAPDLSPLLNIGGGHESTMREVIDLLGTLARTTVPVERTAVEGGDVRRTGADTTLARSQLGWSPRVALRDGLRSELAWVRDRRRGRATAAARKYLLAGRAS